MSKKHRGHAKGDPVTYQTPLPAGGVRMETFLPWTLVRRGLKKQIITPLDAPQEFLDEARRERQVDAVGDGDPYRPVHGGHAIDIHVLQPVVVGPAG